MRQAAMTLELPSEVLTLLSGLEESLARVQSELEHIRSELRSKPERAATPRLRYTVEEVAAQLGKKPYTVREWCRHGQILASKRSERRGSASIWAISTDEVERYRNEGLLPLDPLRNHSD
jgi:hypothetical protein